MNHKRLAVLCAAAAALLLCTACTENASSGTSLPDDHGTESAEPPAEQTTPRPSAASDAETFDAPVEAKAGEAFLAMTDAHMYLQYWGSENDLLAYGAKNAHIEGNCKYTVSIMSDTAGTRLAATGDPNGKLDASGIGYLGVTIKDGANLLPGAVITVDRVTIDGAVMEQTAKNYTFREDGALRASIWNPTVNKPSGGAYAAEGALFIDGDNKQPAFAGAAAYSPGIADLSKVGVWKRIEVNFTVSGLPEAAETTAPQEAAPH